MGVLHSPQVVAHVGLRVAGGDRRVDPVLLRAPARDACHRGADPVAVIADLVLGGRTAEADPVGGADVEMAAERTAAETISVAPGYRTCAGPLTHSPPAALEPTRYSGLSVWLEIVIVTVGSPGRTIGMVPACAVPAAPNATPATPRAPMVPAAMRVASFFRVVSDLFAGRPVGRG